MGGIVGQNFRRRLAATRLVTDINGIDTIACAQIQPDLILAFGVPIIEDALLEQSRLGAVNLHGGISPQYKGSITILGVIQQ